jgi:ribosome-associated toxin RatA of RatAB toxin-antitoxin module
MMKKMTTLRAPVELVHELFSDIGAWPQWMPDIRRARVLERTSDHVRVDMSTVMLGRTFDQTVEFQLQPGRVAQKQIVGQFKKWEAEWRFWAAPAVDATILSAAFDIDFGFLGLFVSERKVADTMNEWFSQLTVNAEEQLKKRPVPRPTASAPNLSPSSPSPAASTETVLQVFQREDGLEVWIQQQRFFIPAAPQVESR